MVDVGRPWDRFYFSILAFLPTALRCRVCMYICIYIRVFRKLVFIRLRKCGRRNGVK